MKVTKESVPIIASVIFLTLSLLGIGSGVYFYRQFQASEEKLKNPENAAKEETRELLAKVAKLILLPDEEAQIATVTDVETLKKTQPFFQDAKDNDKVLLFFNAKKAILYRPSTNVIVNVAPLIESATNSAQASFGTQGPILKIAIRNGTGVVGVASKLEDELKTKIQNFTVTEKDNAQSNDYEKTVVIALSDTLSKTFVQQLANELSATTSSLPSGESKPNADLLIIVGKDRK